jgi:uncharacterized protein YjiS (DUF1127 family)
LYAINKFYFGMAARQIAGMTTPSSTPDDRDKYRSLSTALSQGLHWAARKFEAWQWQRVLREINGRQLADVGLRRAGRLVCRTDPLAPPQGGIRIRDCTEGDLPHI